ncbi:MAG: toxin [Candidatus Pacebacteria bacterium]|nr:toxin [Candidatus Paceibacterota bacterium]
MVFSISFNEEKNQLLKATRDISFEDVVDILEHKQMLDDIAHPSRNYPHQRMYVIAFNNYIYAIPYVIDEKRQEIFLKTIYASRVLTKKYLKEERV